MREEKAAVHLVLTRACPLCHGLAIARDFKGLEDAVSVSWVDGQPSQTNDDMRWSAVIGLPAQKEQPYRLPLMWTSKSNNVTTNPQEIFTYLNVALSDESKHVVDLKPASVAARVDELHLFLQSRLMFPLHMLTCTTRQDVYEVAYRHAHAALFRLEQMLSRNRFLFGYKLTEADCLVFPWLLRYDTVFRHLFKCSLTRVEDLPNLRNYVRELYQLPAVQAVTDVDAIRRSYYTAYAQFDPTGVLPLLGLNYSRPHNRAEVFPMPCCDKGVGQCKHAHVSLGEDEVAAASGDFSASFFRARTLRPAQRLIFRTVGVLATLLLALRVASRKRRLAPAPAS